MRSAALLALFAGASGCLSHLASRSDDHMAIHWANGFADARARAEREQKPILAVMVAGEICGKC